MTCDRCGVVRQRAPGNPVVPCSGSECPCEAPNVGLHMCERHYRMYMTATPKKEPVMEPATDRRWDDGPR